MHSFGTSFNTSQQKLLLREVYLIWIQANVLLPQWVKDKPRACKAKNDFLLITSPTVPLRRSHKVDGSWRREGSILEFILSPTVRFHCANSVGSLLHSRPWKSWVLTSSWVLGLSSTNCHLIPQVCYSCLYEFAGIYLRVSLCFVWISNIRPNL